MFFEKYFNFAKNLGNEVFHGSWTNNNKEVSNDPKVRGHRHDQIVASVLAHQMNFKIHKNDYGIIQWRDSWKFSSEILPKPEILVDGYAHGTHACRCEQCLNSWKLVEEGKKTIPVFYMR